MSDGKAATENDLQRRVLDFLDQLQLRSGGRRQADRHPCLDGFSRHRSGTEGQTGRRLPFLDYSTLEKRKRACEEEARGQRRQRPELYRRVVAVRVRPPARFEIDGAGAPAEWAVEMARFDDSQSLDRVAAAKTIDPRWRRRGRCHRQCHDRAPRADGDRWLASISPIIERNTAKFHTVRGLDTVAIDRLDAASRAMPRRRCGRYSDSVRSTVLCAAATAICILPILPWWTASRCCSTPSSSIP